MLYLGDYIGHLVSEMTLARLEADLEALRIAELYASHPLLKHLPVPHFRLPEAKLDIPIAVKEVQESEIDESPRGKIKFSAMREVFNKLLPKFLGQFGIKLLEKEIEQLKKSIDKRLNDLMLPVEISIGVIHIADELVMTVLNFLTKADLKNGPFEQKVLDEFEGTFKSRIRIEFLKLRQMPPRVLVCVTAKELKELDSSDVLIRINLSISEDAFEWTVIDSDGKPENRLIQE